MVLVRLLRQQKSLPRPTSEGFYFYGILIYMPSAYLFATATNEKDFEDLGTYYALAGGHHDKQLEMHVFLVQTWAGDIAPQAEVAEVRWVDSVSVRGIELTSIFRDDILPLFVKKNLVV